MREVNWFDISMKQYNEDNYSQALVAITNYIEDEPENKNGTLFKAVICRTLNNYNLALLLLKEIEPSEDASDKFKRSYYGTMAETLNGLGNINEALIWFDKYIALNPDVTKGYILKGDCLFESGQIELAKKEYLKATVLTGKPEEAFYNLALISRAEMNFSQAKKYCKKSLEIAPDDEAVLDCLNDIIQAMKLTL